MHRQEKLLWSSFSILIQFFQSYYSDIMYHVAVVSCRDAVVHLYFLMESLLLSWLNIGKINIFFPNL